MIHHYDAVIIGSGQGGTPLSIRLAKAGYKTALIERNEIGGSCINYGCIPSKAIIASSKAAYDLVKASELGINAKSHSIDFKKIMKRKDDIVARFRGGSTNNLEETENLDIIYGEASFSSNKELIVVEENGNAKKVSAEKIFINIGLRPAVPSIDGLNKVPFLTSTEILELKEIPEHLVILGAGYISLELAQAFSRLGSKVTILESEEQILGREDDDVRAEIASFFNEEKIKIITNAKVTKVAKTATGKVKLSYSLPESHKHVSGSHLLVAVGRAPDTNILELNNTAIKLDEDGFINVNDRLETNVAGVYALGDIKGGPAFTHISYNDYQIILNNILNKTKRSTKGRIIPYCMFTDPELGRVGITEKEAKKKGIKIEIAKLPMDKAAKAIIDNHTQGFMKAIVDAKTKKILGAAILCRDGGNIMSVVQIAMEAGWTYEQLKEQMFAHPLLAESLNNLFFTLDK